MKILILTSIYPSPQSPESTTSVVHYFCKEWVKEGNDCIVIHNDNKYSLLFYLLPTVLKKIIEGKFGNVFPNWKQRSKIIYDLDGVSVYRLPMLKLLPTLDFLPCQKLQQARRIDFYLRSIDFIPDIILGHWESPQIDLIYYLSSYYRSAITCCVIHVLKYCYQEELMRKLSLFDAVGFRNQRLLNEYHRNFCITNRNTFICKSGIPERYLNIDVKNTISKHSSCNLSIIYVGGLITRKNPTTIINAVWKIKNNNFITLKFIGDGPEISLLRKKHKELIPDTKIHFESRMDRDAVFREFCMASLMIMVSRGEAFGLVYAEAMAAGCIVIASKNEGFDGIISHGINGFLCEAGDELELAELIDYIMKMTIEQKKSIAINAINTARTLSDKLVAQDYLRDVLKRV